MKKVDLILDPKGFIQNVDSRPTLIHGKVIVVSNGQIEDLCTLNESREKYEAANIVNLKDHILIPGLVNAHNHLSMSLMRGIAMPSSCKWLQNHIYPRRLSLLGEYVKDGTLLRLPKCSLQGQLPRVICTFPEEASESFKKAGMRRTTSHLFSISTELRSKYR